MVLIVKMHLNLNVFKTTNLCKDFIIAYILILFNNIEVLAHY